MLNRLTEPLPLSLSLEQVKAHLRLDHGEEDTHIMTLIRSATAWVESYLGKSLLKQGWQQTWKKTGKQTFSLSKSPVMEVRQVSLVSPCGYRQSLSSYQITERNGAVKLHLKYPLAKNHILEVVYRAGYGERPDDVPEDIRQALLMYVGCLYEHRTTIDRADLVGLYSLLSPHRSLGLA